ncbi:MAG: septum formation protein Maf [Desulfobacterales bacterium]|nr:septum formation protein Maf [Desulfobacterales bacterium]
MNLTFPFISKQYPLILASASPRRKELLAQLGLPFRAMASNVSEAGIKGDPSEAACLLAEKKALRIYSETGESWILGADTMVIIDDKILGKPKHEKETKYMLQLLSGREHSVVTGFCLVTPAGKVAHSEAVITMVRVKDLSEREIEAYIDTDEPFGKAGSYAIQGVGAFMIETISGSYTNVVGLPLCVVVKALVLVGAIRGFPLSLSNNL